MVSNVKRRKMRGTIFISQSGGSSQIVTLDSIARVGVCRTGQAMKNEREEGEAVEKLST